MTLPLVLAIPCLLLGWLLADWLPGRRVLAARRRAAILSALAGSRGLAGLGIIDATAATPTPLTTWSVYPLLRAMERDGLLVSRTEPGGPERGGRPRVVYGLPCEACREPVPCCERCAACQAVLALEAL